MKTRTGLFAAALAGLLALPLAPTPAAAQESRSTVLTLCGTVEADAVPSSDGQAAGFAGSSTAGCPRDLWWLRGSGTQWTTVRSPYRGVVLGVAEDRTGTYLLYSDSDGVRLGKRSTNGAFEPSRLLSAATSEVTGDVAAAAGQWWAVWSEPTGTYQQGQLYQAKTYAGEVGRQRITSHAFAPDREPTLTLTQPGGGGARLAWTRHDAPVEPNSSDIWTGTSPSGSWTFSPTFMAGRYNNQPDMHLEGASHFGFVRDGAPVYADNSSGSFVATAFPRPEGATAESPQVGTGLGRRYLGWLAAGDEFEPVVLATRRQGTWDTRTLDGVGPAGHGSQSLHAVVAGPDGATVLYSQGAVLRATTTNDCVYGAIGERYASLGGASGFLGRATTCEQSTPIRPGRYNHFTGGSIYWTSRTGAWEVHGAIGQAWAQMGWENSAVGFPITNELRTPDRPGAYNHFENGSIYWSGATGPQEIRGAIRQRWAAMGWENSLLGFPVTHELRTPDKPGAFNHFQGPGSHRGSIYWSPSTGAHEVYGAIRSRWASLGWENSSLGFPVTGEYAVPGGRRSDFQGGSITWTPAGGAVVTPAG